MNELPNLQLKEGMPGDRLSDLVYDTLLQAILDEVLASGVIVSEVALAKELDVSRTPVHDALRQLEKDGLIRQEANRRAVVSGFASEDIHDIFEMRKILESESAQRAATRIDRQTLTSLRETALDLKDRSMSQPKNLENPNSEDTKQWLADWARFDADFHDQIAQASGSPRLWTDVTRYRQLHCGMNKYATTVECLQQAIDEHIAILDALQDRDAERARRTMFDHIQEWQAYFTAKLQRERRDVNKVSALR